MSDAAGHEAVMRHLTVTGILVHQGRALLHWHRLTRLWLPLGGHIEANEDPVQAVLREIAEESGVAAEVLPTTPPVPFANLPQLPPPATILIARLRGCSLARAAAWTGPVEHIDSVYYCRPVAGIDSFDAGGRTVHWLTAEELHADQPLAVPGDDESPRVPEDVRVLALAALGAAAGR